MKLKLLSSLTLVALISFGTFAQDQGEFKAQLGLVYGTKAGVDEDGEKGQLGITPGLEYFLIDNLSVGASYDWYFSNTVEDSFLGEIKASLSSFNIDARYYFLTDGVQVYGLAGVGILRAKVDIGGFTISDSETGLNVGAGAIFPISDSMGINIQGKYQTAAESNIAINAGISYSF